MGLRGINATPLPRKERKGALTYAQYYALWFGNNFFHNLGPVFKNENEFRACWQKHRDKIIYKQPGRRPWAWWVYEGGPMGLRCPKGKDRAEETILLFEAGVLTRAEIETLMPQWREHWEKTLYPDFASLHDGGIKAYRKWAGVPLKVWIAFDAEREAKGRAAS